MQAEQLIYTIQCAQRLGDVLDTTQLRQQYRQAVCLLHPDRCSLAGAVDALLKLQQLKDEFEQGKSYTDDAGDVLAADMTITFRGEQALLEKSLQNFLLLKNIRTNAAQHFQRYLPTHLEWNGSLQATLAHRAIPLYNLTLPQEHVNWILSRLLEVCAWLAQEGMVYAGINPTSVWIVPETHGIVLPSFYHLTRTDTRLRTISAAYKNWYPAEIFTTKRAETVIDLELCKRTAAWLLGDKSGIGVKLQRTHHPAFVQFLLQRHTDAYACYEAYRNLLAANFESKFYFLTL